MMKELGHLQEAVFSHVQECFPREACGLIVAQDGASVYYPCRNLSVEPHQFCIDPWDWKRAEDAGDVFCVVHSHCNETAEPSMADRVACERTQLPWVIVSWPNRQVEWLYPTGYRAPLIGRPFVYGVLDCWSLVRDYYDEVLFIKLPHFDSEDGWWNRGQNLMAESIDAAGFVRVDQPRRHDVILSQLRSPVASHSMVYLGNNKILHHVPGRLSSIDVYGGYWLKNTRSVCRHKSLLDMPEAHLP